MFVAVVFVDDVVEDDIRFCLFFRLQSTPNEHQYIISKLRVSN